MTALSALGVTIHNVTLIETKTLRRLTVKQLADAEVIAYETPHDYPGDWNYFVRIEYRSRFFGIKRRIKVYTEFCGDDDHGYRCAVRQAQSWIRKAQEVMSV